MDYPPEEFDHRDTMNEAIDNGEFDRNPAGEGIGRISFGRRSLRAMADEGGFIDPLAAIR